MRLPKLGLGSKNSTFKDACKTLEIELPHFETSNGKKGFTGNGKASSYLSFKFGSSTSIFSQKLTKVAAKISSQLTATTTENSAEKEEPLAPTNAAESHHPTLRDFEGAKKPSRTSGGKIIKRAIVNYTGLARNAFFKPTAQGNITADFSKEIPASFEKTFPVDTPFGGEDFGANSGVQTQSHGAEPTSHGPKICNHKVSRSHKKSKIRAPRRLRRLAAKRRRAKRRTRSGKASLSVPRKFEAWEDIKKNVKQPEDNGYDLNFDYNKILKPSFVDSWLNDTVKPLAAALPVSVEQLSNHQIRYAPGFEDDDVEPERTCAHCRRDTTGFSGIGNCVSCYYFWKTERTEFAKYGDAKKVKRIFGPHADILRSPDYEDSFASTGDSRKGICLEPIYSVWEKIDRGFFQAKMGFRRFKASVPDWSRKVRKAANEGYGWRSLRPEKYGRKSKLWGDLLPQDFSPRYDEFWPKDVGPADFYQVEVDFRRRGQTEKVSFSDTEHAYFESANGWAPNPEIAPLSIPLHELDSAVRKIADDLSANSILRDAVLAQSYSKVEASPESKPATSASGSSSSFYFVPTGPEVLQTFGFDFFSGAKTTGDPNDEWATCEKPDVFDSTAAVNAGTTADTSTDLLATAQNTSEVNSTDLKSSSSSLVEPEIVSNSAETHVHQEGLSFMFEPEENLPMDEEFKKGSTPVIEVGNPTDLGSEGSETTENSKPMSFKDIGENDVDMEQRTGLLSSVQGSIETGLFHLPEDTRVESTQLSNSTISVNIDDETIFQDQISVSATPEHEYDDDIKDIHTRNDSINPHSMKNLTKELVDDILASYHAGKYDQVGRPQAAAETLGALLDEVFKGVQGYSDEFVDGEMHEDVPSPCSSEHDDSHRFTLLSDSEDEILGTSNSFENFSDDDVSSLVVLKRPKVSLKELMLVRRDANLTLRTMKRLLSGESANSNCSLDLSIAEETKPILRHLKLVKPIPTLLPAVLRTIPLKVLGDIVEPVHQSKEMRNAQLYPVVEVSNLAPDFSGELETLNFGFLGVRMAMLDSHVDGVLSHSRHCGRLVHSQKQVDVEANVFYGPIKAPEDFKQSIYVKKDAEDNAKEFKRDDEGENLKEAVAEKEDSLWLALGLGQNFDRKLSHQDVDDFEFVLVKESMPKMKALSKMIVDAANRQKESTDVGTKTETKVLFEVDDGSAESEFFQSIERRSIDSCAPSKSSLKHSKHEKRGRFLIIKEFTQPRDLNERIEIDNELRDKLEKCRQGSSTLEAKSDMDKRQSMFELFFEFFTFSGEKYADVATNQILEYADWLDKIKGLINAALALTSGSGNQFNLLVEFIDKADKSKSSMKKAEKATRGLMESLSSAMIMLEQVQEAILQLRLEFPDYVGTMAEIAGTAVSSKKEILNIYSSFCSSQLSDSLDVALVHHFTGYEKFIEVTRYLNNWENPDYEVTFAKILNDLQSAHDIVDVARTDLEKRLKLIIMGLSNLRFEYDCSRMNCKRMSQSTANNSTTDLSLGGPTLTGSTEDVSSPVIKQEKQADNMWTTHTKNGQRLTELSGEKQGEKQGEKKKYAVPGWMKFKGLGKKS